MKKNFTAFLLTLAVFTVGCAALNNFKAAANTANTNVNTNTTTATPSAPANDASPAEPEATPTPTDKADLGRDYLAFGAGANIVAVTSESKMNYEKADKLIDESKDEGWKSADGQYQNQSVTLELPARTTLKTLVFDTKFTGEGKFTAKNIMVEVSDTSANDGFQTILEATLQDQPKPEQYVQGWDNQVVKVSKEVAGRFVRYTAKDNYGSTKVVFTKEMRGYGTQEPRPMIENISGTYQMYGGAIVHLKQEGSLVIGCNEQSEAVISGTMEGRVLTFEAKKPKQVLRAFGVYSFAPDGRTFKSATWTGDKKGFDFAGTGARKADQIGKCPILPDLDAAKGGTDAAKKTLEKNLAETGRSILYGINFDFNSDVIRPESRPTLDKVVAILQENAAWKMQIEGHTDNVGGSTFNQPLSDKRAAAVKKYLFEKGIDASRLTSAGFGLSKPIATNENEGGRAQNRRVEVVKQ